MTNISKKNLHLPLVFTGYVLFALLVITTLFSTTFPLTRALFYPGAIHLNITVMLVAFTIGSILPVLLGYYIGDHAIKTKSRVRHHFTGVLFGLLAYFIMTFLSVLIVLPPAFREANLQVSFIILNVLPSVGVAVIATILSIAHVRGRHAKQDILSYTPFSSVLMAAIVALPLWSLIHNLTTNNVSVYSFVPLILVGVAGLVSYAMLRKTKLNKHGKIVWSAVSVAVLFFTMFVVPQFVLTLLSYIVRTPTTEAQAVISLGGFVLALGIWIAYWVKQVRSL